MPAADINLHKFKHADIRFSSMLLLTQRAKTKAVRAFVQAGFVSSLLANPTGLPAGPNKFPIDLENESTSTGSMGQKILTLAPNT